jgi:hypothetical protein
MEDRCVRAMVALCVGESMEHLARLWQNATIFGGGQRRVWYLQWTLMPDQVSFGRGQAWFQPDTKRMGKGDDQTLRSLIYGETERGRETHSAIEFVSNCSYLSRLPYPSCAFE